MPAHVIVVDRRSEFPWQAPGRIVVEAREMVSDGGSSLPASARVINLCRDLSYLSLGYYVSLLAQARAQKIIPSVEVMLDLHWKRLLRIALPEVDALVCRLPLTPPQAQAGDTLRVPILFGTVAEPGLAPVARRVFELFRCPILMLELKYRRGWSIASIRPGSLRDLTPDRHPDFVAALDRYTRAAWKGLRAQPGARFAVAVLHAPEDPLPPSNARALEKFVRAGARMGLEVEPITRADYGRLAEFDALLIRETTALDNHTYRFAKKAESEGIAVIDDPHAILTCTNKIFLAEALRANGVPAPRTLIVDRRRLARVERLLGFPVVLKVPDGSFSRGVFKAHDATELRRIAERMFRDTDLIIAQEYMRTEFDWRVGVLDGQPLFVCQYYMARDHWQIVKHGGPRGQEEGRARTFAVEAAPAEVIRIATEAAGLIGDGLFGVDLKENERGIFVVEINDNPNIDAGVEDAVLRDGLYAAILKALVRRIDRRARHGAGQAAQPGDLAPRAAATRGAPSIRLEEEQT
jgi:glutathione synthase/RimK-type ligase-like ATP-grasp enzyme